MHFEDEGATMGKSMHELTIDVTLSDLVGSDFGGIKHQTKRKHRSRVINN